MNDSKHALLIYGWTSGGSHFDAIIVAYSVFSDTRVDDVDEMGPINRFQLMDISHMEKKNGSDQEVCVNGDGEIVAFNGASHLDSFREKFQFLDMNSMIYVSARSAITAVQTGKLPQIEGSRW